MKKIVNWLIMRKVKQANGELQTAGVSYTKAALVCMAVLKGLETTAFQLGHPIIIPDVIYQALGVIAGISAKEGIDRSSAPPPAVDTSAIR